ncbi:MULTISPECIES: histidine phosphatase family protein [Subtercola]|uniref:Histidine phosphatase family protein n=1 Tax=Subtercola vilae TaxID=2056433 RepID=A0A4T2C911_9MICO|nr:MULTISPECIES: histidine phosphatase family protein [Subtercola]MEA9983758.1 histidine phosphatase family protein [Subtercola sp. RTI3]TIH40700.1 histidine phosphatase family protein [Subtercola vilae]
MTYLALVRHGQTDWNLQKRIQGSTDIPLNATGRAQALDTASFLAGGDWDAVLTSPLGRARETAQIIATSLSLPSPQPVAGLVERRYGEAEGLDFEELHERFPGQSHVPGRETHRQVRERVHVALIEAAEARPGQQLIVVCHGGVISSLVRYATDGGRPREDERIPNGSVHYFSYIDGVLRLDEFNGEPVNQLALRAAPEEPSLTPPS